MTAEGIAICLPASPPLPVGEGLGGEGRAERRERRSVFKKILVANRGEIAVRIIRACHDMGIAAVAVYSQADAESLHVKLADESVCIGPPPNRDSYLNIPNLVTAAIIKECDAVHPGYGNLSETVAFAENCEIARLKFIGPKPEIIEKMQDKAQAKQLVARAGVPVIPGTDGVLTNAIEGLKIARRFGYPVMIKAAAGGGGRGIRIVRNDDEFQRNLPLAQAEAQASFGPARSIPGEIYRATPAHRGADPRRRARQRRPPGPSATARCRRSRTRSSSKSRPRWPSPRRSGRRSATPR